MLKASVHPPPHYHPPLWFFSCFFLCRSVSRHHFLHRLHRNLISLKRTHTHTDSLLCTCTQSQADIQIGPDTHLHMQTHIIQLMSVSVRASG